MTKSRRCTVDGIRETIGFDIRSVICAAVCAVACSLPLAAQTTEDSREDVNAREEYFWAQRSYPSTVRPYEQMQRAFTRTASQLQARFSLSVSAGVPGGWRSLGPNGIFGADNGFFSSGPMLDAGRVTAVAPSPAGGTLFIGTASGGVWRSSSGGYWIPLTDTQCNLMTGAVTIDPADANTIYAGTGEYNTGSWGCGILRSTDGGASWTQLGASSFRVTVGGQPSGSAAFSKILVSRSAGGTVLLGATNVGVFRSPDGGSTWSFVLPGASAGLVAHPSRSGVVFAGNSDNFNASRRGVYKSVDNGATWTPLPPPPVDVSSIQRIELAVTPASPDLVYALVGGKDFKFLGLFLWNDAAGSWTKLGAVGLYTGSSRGDFGAQAYYDLAIAIDPRDANRVYVAGVRAFRSTDGGATFNPMGMEIHSDWHVIGIDPLTPDILYAGTDGGVFVSTDRGDNWVSRNAGLTITQYYPGISSSPNGSTIMGGAQDLGTHFFTGSSYWNGFLGGDGGYTAINYDNPAVRYAETQWQPTGPLLVRFDATTATIRVSGIGKDDRHAFIPPYVMDPIASGTLYFGTHLLYKTVNEGAAWTALSFDLSKGSGYITTIAVAKSDPSTIYTGASDGMVSVTRDGGVTFNPINTGLPNRWVTDIAVDQTDATHALLTVSGFGSGHIFETKNAGASWTDISGGLPDAPTNAVVFVPNVGIMVGTDVGVFQASSPGATFTIGPAGIPNVIVYDLIYAPAANLLLAGTYGRGMFAYTVGGETPVLRGDANADGKVDAFDALLIQQSLIGILPAGTSIYPRGDADCNQMIQTADAVFVLRAAVGLASPGVCVNTVK